MIGSVGGFPEHQLMPGLKLVDFGNAYTGLVGVEKNLLRATMVRKTSL